MGIVSNILLASYILLQSMPASGQATTHGFHRSGLPSFTELAGMAGTDKVSSEGHHYDYIYERYLPLMRHKQVVVLEIGLGCMNAPFGELLGGTWY